MQEPSTRLIVKNVPKHVDEKRLRQHFAERGEVRFCGFRDFNTDHRNRPTPRSNRVLAWTSERLQGFEGETTDVYPGRLSEPYR